MAIKDIIHNITKTAADHSPQIMTALGVAGVLSTTVLAVKATPEALRRIEVLDDDATVVDQIKAGWKPYIPAAVMGSVTITCIIAGNSISTKRNAAIMSAFTLTEQSFREYQEKTREVVGKKREEDIRTEIVQDRLKNDDSYKEVVVLGSGADVLFLDMYSNRYFMSTMETVRKAVNDINEKVLNSIEGSASLNEFYDLIHLPRAGAGEEVGWSTDNTLDIRYTTALSDDDKPCIAIEFRKVPLRGYYANVF